MAPNSANTRAVMSWSYGASWTGLFLLHIINMGYYVGFAVFYNSIYHTNLAFQFLTYSIGIAEDQYAGIGWTHAAVSTLHGYCILQMVGASVVARRLTFFPATSLKTIATRVVSQFRLSLRFRRAGVSPHESTNRFTSTSQLVVTTVSRTASSVFGRQGLLGVNGVYYDDLLVIRELFETALQSYQAYRMTLLLPRLGLIRVYVGLLVANCLSVSILHRVYRDRCRHRRIVSLLCDAVLDTVSSIGITLLIAASYVNQYTDPTFGFPFVNWFNDQWFTSVHQEFQMMLVVSWGDMASRLVFAVGLLLCMDDIKSMLESASSISIPLVTQGAKRSTAAVPEGPNSTLLLMRKASARVSLLGRVQRAQHFLLHTVGPPVLVLWGVAILAVHIYAESKGANWSCNLPLRPWLNSQPACLLVEINCHELGLPGRAASLEAAWTLFDPMLTAHLTIRHCPELVVPPAIQLYRQLTSIKVYNSTIIAWPAASAITTQSHGALRAMYFVRTGFPNATLPPGLTTPDFPKSFRSFVASATNLASLPDDLHLAWPPFMSIALEASQFTAVPDVFTKLMPAMVSLALNPIASVPASLFENPALLTLMLCYAPIQELPRNVTNPSARLFVVNLLGTNISTLWSWLEPTISLSFSFHSHFFNLGSSPFCSEREQIETGLRTTFSASETVPMADLASVMDVSTPAKLTYSQEAAWCGASMPAFFPLPLEDAVSAMAYSNVHSDS